MLITSSYHEIGMCGFHIWDVYTLQMFYYILTIHRWLLYNKYVDFYIIIVLIVIPFMARNLWTVHAGDLKILMT